VQPPTRKKRTFETTIVIYFLLPTLLTRLPFFGPLVQFPAAAIGAHCLRDIMQAKPSAARRALRDSGDGGGGGGAVA
jgi:hypothetical protein